MGCYAFLLNERESNAHAVQHWVNFQMNLIFRNHALMKKNQTMVCIELSNSVVNTLLPKNKF